MLLCFCHHLPQLHPLVPVLAQWQQVLSLNGHDWPCCHHHLQSRSSFLLHQNSSCSCRHIGWILCFPPFFALNEAPNDETFFRGKEADLSCFKSLSLQSPTIMKKGQRRRGLVMAKSLRGSSQQVKEVGLNVGELCGESHTSHQGTSSPYLQTEEGEISQGLLRWTSGIFPEKVVPDSSFLEN